MNHGTLLFVSDRSHLDSEIPGGVQICTQEYMDLLKETGFELTTLPVTPRKDIQRRVLNRSFPNPYRQYDAEAIAEQARSRIADSNTTVVAINQVNLLPVGRVLKNKMEEITILSLSHGNESGDTLHEVLRKSGGWLDWWTDALQLGRMIIQEARAFTNVVDLMLCMSEMEQNINAWMGAERSMVVPRTFEPDFLNWSPVRGRFGFVGTLNHLPNEEGIRRVLEALERRHGAGLPSIEVRIVGGPEDAGEELEHRFPSATYCGRLPQKDFKQEAATWGLFLNPIWWYARGASMKLAQAVNWGLPVVTTHPGKRGYTWSKGTVQVSETPDEMAGLLVKATRKPQMLQRFAEESRTVAQNGPTLDNLSTSLSRHLDELHN